MKRIDEVEGIKLFKLHYGKTPKEAGYPVIDIYERQHAYLYATSEKVIKAYKTQQNILRWMMLWYMWPMAIAFINFFDALKYQDVFHQRCIATYIFFGAWLILAIVLGIKVRQTGKLIELGKNITYLNY